MLTETASEMNTRIGRERMGDYARLEYFTAELEEVANAILIHAAEMRLYDSGESERVTALIYSLGLVAADFDRRQTKLREVVNRIVAEKERGKSL